MVVDDNGGIWRQATAMSLQSSSAEVDGPAMLAPLVTAMVITYNEEANIKRTLDRLTWAKSVLLIDSGSSDATLALAAQYPNVRVVTNPFVSFAQQCNFGLQQVQTEWVLSLDADYELSTDLVEEIAGLRSAQSPSGFKAAFTYCIHGHKLRSSLYPPRTVLYRREAARYEDEGHGHRVRIAGAVNDLKCRIHHDDRKSLSRWFASQIKYADLESKALLAAESGSLPMQDKIRRRGWLAPWLVFGLTYFGKGLFLNGWAGLHYSLQRLLAEIMLSICLIDLRLKGTGETRKQG